LNYFFLFPDYSAEQLEEAYGAMVPSPSNTAADQAQSRNGRPATGLAASQQHLFTRDGNQQQPAPIMRLHLSSSAPDIDVLEQEGSTDGRADGHHSAEISIQDETLNVYGYRKSFARTVGTFFQISTLSNHLIFN
jgi:hypothetical protein